jgi:uncharacterized membrane protein YhhN
MSTTVARPGDLPCHAAPVELIWVLPAAAALVDWYAVGRGDRRTETWAKPLTLLGLVVVALALGATGTAAGTWVLVALLLGLAGDVLLLGDSEGRFRLGLTAFLLGHLAYVVAFSRLGVDPPTWQWAAWLVLFACLVATRRVVPATFLRGGRTLAFAVAAYTVVIGAMVIVAFDTGEPLVAVGATVFAASDSVLAVDRFVEPRPWAPLVVMVTYHVGQALVVAGVLAAA